MFLPGSKNGEVMCRFAQQILTDVSAAFHHSFSLLQDKIGEEAIKTHEEALTDETVENCLACRAVFLGDSTCEGADELYDALDLPLRIRSFAVPAVLCGRHEAPVSLYLGKVLSIDPETLRKALHSAFRFAQEEERHIQHVAPAGAAKSEWEAAVRVQEVSFPALSVSALSAPDAMEDIILSPEKMGLLLCPPYAGSILQSAANALCNHPMLIHDISFDENIGLYSPYIPDEITEPLNPVTAALCVARLLRYSLGLSTEAGCVEAAVNNVLSAWHAPSAAPVDPDELIDLICEQVNVAGELMGKPLPS